MNQDEKRKFTADLGPVVAWAFALGTSVGWGSLVVTSNSYLAEAGPVGSVAGLIIGTVVMLIISRNYAYMMQIHPDAGGAYTYSKEVFGYDYGFLSAWFLALVYLAILWANATSIPLFVRNFIGDIFEFGRMYSFFGYDVYFGETLITIAAIVLIALLCILNKRAAMYAMVGLVFLFTLGITIVFIAAVSGFRGSFSPAFVPDSEALSQIIKIAIISPWAFIGFESISHRAGEFSFKGTKIFRVFVAAVISTALLYIFVTLLSVTAYPDRYGSWLEYISDRGNLSGLEAFPAFYAANHYLGSPGVVLLMLSLFALIITSLIGNTTALSRLFYSLGKDKIIPACFGRLNKHGVPGHAILLIAGISLIAPFAGRTAIGWIVDVTTIGATLIYGFVSATAMTTAKVRADRTERITGTLGLALMVAFGAYLLLPNLVTTGSLEKETYFIFIVWSVLGFLYFRHILHTDRERRFGTSGIVWIALLSLVLLLSLIWMRQSMIATNQHMIENVRSYYEKMEDEDRMEDEEYIRSQVEQMDRADSRTMLMAVCMFGFALTVMLTNHSYMSKHSREHERQANTDPMTGVRNKNAYLFKEAEIDAGLQEGEIDAFSVVVCDVNGLKKINDTYGHKAGDEYIVKACRMICDIFSHSPVYRTGGDEFVMVLTGRDYDNRRELMRTLHDRSVANISRGEVVVSGGISDHIPGQDSCFHDAFERADGLMYEEKQLLKGLGSISRDEAPDEQPAEGTPSVFNIRKQILIVEDEMINQNILGQILQEDYELLFASDGEEALEQIRHHKEDLDLVLLDLIMPRMDGTTVLKKMKEDKGLQDIPVIVMTADQNSEVECLKLGAVDFISKPYPAKEIILARVNKCIELYEDRDTIQSTERDSQTNLYNIEYFMRYVHMYDRHYWDMPMDAVVMDITGFRLINERHGKQYGDSVLFRMGDSIRRISREIGAVSCRRGADTFLMYCPHRDDYSDLLKRVCESVSDEDESSGRRIRVHVRMGIYPEVDKSLDIERRYDRAKMASDTVKGDRVRPIAIYNAQMHETAIFKERLLEDFQSSIKDNRFRVYYQPKYDIRPDTPVLFSTEALVRWEHPEFGMISPAVFIPLLEESGLILELDTFVWKETAARIRAWKDEYGFSVPVSVNVSRVDMLAPNLKEIFTEILETYNLTFDDMTLEITESAYTGDSEQVISTARELRGMGMGFRIEMDDFGTGYSSLGMLSHLPIDALKLDMSFIRNAFGETRDTRMIELIIDIADYLHVPVVAEGVETEEQLLVLKALGCDYVQGYYFSRPVPPEEFTRFLVERSKQSLEIVPEAKKTCLSISQALNADFESIFYVDTMTGYYLEFYSVAGEDLKIRPGGTDFFADAPDKLLADVDEKDVDMIRDALKQEHLLSLMGKEDTVTFHFNRQKGDSLKPFCLQTIRTRSSDDQHVVIGIRPAAEQKAAD